MLSFFSVYGYALDAPFPPVLINKYPERGKREWKKKKTQLTKHETCSGKGTLLLAEADWWKAIETTCHVMQRYTTGQPLFLARAWIIQS